MTIGAVRTGRNERRELWTVVKEREGFFSLHVYICALRNAVWIIYGCCHFRSARSSRALVTGQKPQTISPFIYKFHFNHFFLFLFLLFHQKANTFGEIICYFPVIINEPSNNSRCLLLCPTIRRTGARPTDVEWLHGPTLFASTASVVSPRYADVLPPFCHWIHQWIKWIVIFRPTTWWSTSAVTATTSPTRAKCAARPSSARTTWNSTGDLI